VHLLKHSQIANPYVGIFIDHFKCFVAMNTELISVCQTIRFVAPCEVVSIRKLHSRENHKNVSIGQRCVSIRMLFKTCINFDCDDSTISFIKHNSW